MADLLPRNILVSGDLLHGLKSWLLSSLFQFGPRYRVYAKKWTKLKISYLTLSCFKLLRLGEESLHEFAWCMLFWFFLDKGCKLENIS